MEYRKLEWGYRLGVSWDHPHGLSLWVTEFPHNTGPQGVWAAPMCKCAGEQERNDNHFHVTPSEITQGHLHLVDSEGITTVPKFTSKETKNSDFQPEKQNFLDGQVVVWDKLLAAIFWKAICYREESLGPSKEDWDWNLVKWPSVFLPKTLIIKEFRADTQITCEEKQKQRATSDHLTKE